MMTEDLDADSQRGAASRRRMILCAALALCGLAVGSDAQGAVAACARMSLHQVVEWNAWSR
jgi:hypothetical protein